MNEHLSEAQIAEYLEGCLTGWDRRAVERHLSSCLVCAEEVGEAFHWLRSQDLLPPRPLYHPIESGLSWLQRLAPLPVWFWHAIVSALIPLSWWLLDLPRQLAWMPNFRYQMVAWLATWVLTIHFVYLQSQLRRFHRLLWASSIELGRIETWQDRYLAPLQGWLRVPWRRAERSEILIPAWWTLLVLTIGAEVLNGWVQPGPRGTVPDMAARVIGFYNLYASTATALGWVLGARYLVGLGRFLWRHPLASVTHEEVRESLRQIVHWWIIVCGVGGTWAMGWSAYQTGHFLHPWVELYSGGLLIFFVAHQWLTWRVLRLPDQDIKWRWRSVIESGVALGPAMSGLVLALAVNW